MLEMLIRWYKRRFADPHAIALVAILLIGFGIIYFLHNILAPVLIAIVLAYLLDWPTSKLQKMGFSRSNAVLLILGLFIALVLITIFLIIPVAWQQAVGLVIDLPKMLNQLYDFLRTVPAHYPALVDIGILNLIVENSREKLMLVGDSIVKYSLASLIGVVILAIYFVLVPLMTFFLLKDKIRILHYFRKILPRNRALAGKVWVEMHQQISNYIRGKVIEVLVVGIATYIAFWLLNVPYTLLLSVLVGLSVFIPYIGAVLVTIPVVFVCLYQWGISAEFWTVMVAYLVIQALDGNLLVPILFSEMVNLPPLVIILAVVIFGGFWGFWGVFFAIPLASLVKAVINVWPEDPMSDKDNMMD